MRKHRLMPASDMEFSYVVPHVRNKCEALCENPKLTRSDMIKRDYYTF